MVSPNLLGADLVGVPAHSRRYEYALVGKGSAEFSVMPSVLTTAQFCLRQRIAALSRVVRLGLNQEVQVRWAVDEGD